jgi:hypothetical protein
MRLSALLCIFAASSAFAQAPSAADLLAKYEQALGGKDAIQSLKSRVAKGLMEVPDDNVSFPFETYEKAPDKFILTVSDPDSGPNRQALNGASGWTQDSDSGLHDMTKQELVLAGRDHDFYRDIHLASLYPTMKVTGKEHVGTATSWVIEASAADGATEKLYFDIESGLLIKRDYERVNMDSGIVLYQVYFHDYRKVNGVMLPFEVRQTTPDDEQVFKYQDIQANVPVEDAVFVKPVK